MIETLQPEGLIATTLSNAIGIKDLEVPTFSIEPSTTRTTVERYEYMLFSEVMIILAINVYHFQNKD